MAVTAKVSIPANRCLVGTFIVVALMAAEILCGAAVAVFADQPYVILISVIGLIAGVVTFIEPVQGLYLFVAAMFTEGLLDVGTGTTGTKLLGVLVFGAWVAHSLVTDKCFRIVLPVQSWFAIGFVVWGGMSALWALDAQPVLSEMSTLIQLIGLYILVVDLVNSPEKIQNVLSVIIIVSLVLALLATFRLFSGELVAGRVDTREITGDDPNFLAAYLLPGAALLMARFGREVQLRKKLFLLLALLITVTGILATSSRGAVVALVLALSFGLMLDRRMWQVMLPALLVAGVVPFFLPSISLERIESIGTLSDRGAGRLDIWLVGWRIFCANPLLGVGLGNFGVAFGRYLFDTIGVAPQFPLVSHSPHSIFLGVLSSLGVIGFVLFVAVVGLSVKDGLVAVLRLKQKQDSHLMTLAIGVYLGLLGTLIAGLFIDLDRRKYFWLLLALTEVVRRVSLASVTSESGSATDPSACVRQPTGCVRRITNGPPSGPPVGGQGWWSTPSCR
jgi:hypothetical protein